MVVSIHDVAPATEQAVRSLLATLDEMGATRRTLLVIPHRRLMPLTASTSLCELLRSEAARGNELVVHGFTHRRRSSLRGPLPRRMRARLFAPADAEFLSVDLCEAGRRAEAGRRLLQAAGLRSDAFCAPAWLGVSGLEPALAAAGYRLSVRMGSVVDVRSGRRASLAWSGYMGCGGVHEALVSAAGLARRSAPRSSALQVFLHPADAPASPACGRTLRLIERLLPDRAQVRYADLLA